MITNFEMTGVIDEPTNTIEYRVKFTNRFGHTETLSYNFSKQALYSTNYPHDTVKTAFYNMLIGNVERNEVMSAIQLAMNPTQKEAYYNEFYDITVTHTQWAKGGYIGIIKTPIPPPVDNGLSTMARQLPGINEIVKCPCGEHLSSNVLDYTDTIFHIIIHLNDAKKWTREQIADWLETLDVDLKFKTPTKENENVQA